MENDNKFDAQLFQAINEKNIQRVEHLLKQGANPNSLVYVESNQFALDVGEQAPVLVIACVIESIEIVETLLEFGADVNGKYKNCYVYPGDEEPTGDDEGTALTVASRLGNRKLFDLLLRCGADPNFRVGRWGGFESPLIAAVKGPNATIVKDLLALGAQVNQIDRAGKTALHIAAENNHIELFLMLLAAGGRFRNALELKTVVKDTRRKHRTRLLRKIEEMSEADLVI